jgi:hypothetical protein
MNRMRHHLFERSFRKGVFGCISICESGQHTVGSNKRLEMIWESCNLLSVSARST